MNTLTVLIALCCTCLTSVQPLCDSRAPDTCTFESWDSCNWNMTSKWVVYTLPSGQRSLGLSGHHKDVERLESGPVCATNNAVHCLIFFYRFEYSDVVQLSVIRKTSAGSEDKLWEMSSSHGWQQAKVPVRSRSEFTLIIETRSSNERRVFIDTIKYEKKACELKPVDALPPPIILMTNSPATLGVGINNTTPFHADKQPTSSDAGVVVGVVVAVVCLLLVGVVLCVLFKRKRLRGWQKCCRSQEQKDEGTCRPIDISHSRAHTQNGAETERFLRMDTNPGVSDRDAGCQRYSDTSPTSSSPTENYYCVIDTPSEDNRHFKFSTLEYDQVADTKKLEDPNLQQGHLYSGDSSYDELTDVNAKISKTLNQQPACLLYQNTPGAAAHTRKHEHKPQSSHNPEKDPELSTEDLSVGVVVLPAGKTTSKSKLFVEPYEVREVPVWDDLDPTNDNSRTPCGQTPPEVHPGSSQVSHNGKVAPYHQLDFEGKTPAEEETDDVSCVAYSHLNDGSEEGYDEVDRDHREEVIDQDYSHI